MQKSCWPRRGGLLLWDWGRETVGETCHMEALLLLFFICRYTSNGETTYLCVEHTLDFPLIVYLDTSISSWKKVCVNWVVYSRSLQPFLVIVPHYDR